MDIIGKGEQIVFACRRVDEGFEISMMSRRAPLEHPIHRFKLSDENEILWLREQRHGESIVREFSLGKQQIKYLERGLWDLIEGKLVTHDASQEIGESWKHQLPGASLE